MCRKHTKKNERLWETSGVRNLHIWKFHQNITFGSSISLEQISEHMTSVQFLYLSVSLTFLFATFVSRDIYENYVWVFPFKIWGKLENKIYY